VESASLRKENKFFRFSVIQLQIVTSSPRTDVI